MTLKIEAGKKSRTRGGDEVEVLKTDLPGNTPVLGVYLHHGDWETGGWNLDGYFSSGTFHIFDIISEIKPKRVVWLNVYPEDDGGFYYDSRAEADRQATPYRIACIRVEFEEGQFDNE